jgi:cyclase
MITKKFTKATHKNKLIGKLLGTAVLSALLSGAAFAQDLSDVEVQSYHVQGNVWVLSGAGGNVTVQIGDQGVLVVDTQFAETAPKIVAEIERLAPGKIIRYVINTHMHGDHTGGNEIVRLAGDTIVAGNEARDVADTGAEIIAHENVMLSMATASPAVPFENWPTEVYIGNKYDFYFNGEPVELLYQGRAHTNGDSIVFFRKSDVISSGDIYVTEGFPFIDEANYGHINGIIDGLNQIISITVPLQQQESGTLVISSHGRISDEADVVEYRDMLTIIRDRVQYLIDEGMSLQEVLEVGPARDYSNRYGHGFVSTEDFITAVYNNLSE